MAGQAFFSLALKMYRRPGYPHEATPHPCNLRACCRACLQCQSIDRYLYNPLAHSNCTWEEMTVSRQSRAEADKPPVADDLLVGNSQQKASLRASGSSSRA